MTQGRLQRTIDDYRKRLRQHEAQAEQQLEQAYQRVLAAIDPTLNRLYDQMVEQMAGGAQIPLSWLMEAQRLENIKKLIDSQMNGYGQFGLTTTRQLQQIGLMLGQQGAMAMLNATIPAGVRWTFGMPSTRAIAALVGSTQAGSPLADLFAGFGREAAKNVSDALVRGVSLGDNPRKVARDVQDALGIERARALTISRTEGIRAYRSANLSIFQENADVVGGWIWSAALGSACAVCTAMNGTKHTLDETLDSHPNCRCAMLPETKSWEDILGPLGVDVSSIPDTTISIQSGESWFDEQDAATQRQVLGGAKFAAYQAGDLDLGDLVGVSHSEDWGTSRYQKSLKAAIGAKKAAKYQKASKT